MIYDRPYMKYGEEPHGLKITMLGWILITLGIVFLLQNILQVFFQVNGLLRTGERMSGGFLANWLVLSQVNIAEFKIWTFFTYSLFHANLFHLLVNALVLFFMGRAVEAMLGERGFLRLYLICVLCGGLLWSLVNFGQMNASVIGASAGVIGVLSYFCLRHPNEPITLLLFFIIPVTVLPKWVLLAVVGFSIFGLVFSEWGPAWDGIAHSAHLGGVVGAFLYYKWADRISVPRIRFGSGKKDQGTLKPKYKVNLGSQKAKVSGKSVSSKKEESLRGEIDRILDKINEHGFGSLTENEKETLNRGKELLRR